MINLTEILKPETDLERKIIADPEFVEGAMWGKPRKGHPEGEVAHHIREVFDNIDKYSTPLNRRDLRLIALIHDTFKHKVDETKPKFGANHHATIARRFAEKYKLHIDLLEVIELHDEAYNAWSMGNRKGDWNSAQKRIDKLIQRLNDENFSLYMTFYQCDNETGDKSQENFVWFKEQFV